ncbi:MAG: serine protease [Acidimicrobiales bacterium]
MSSNQTSVDESNEEIVDRSDLASEQAVSETKRSVGSKATTRGKAGGVAPYIGGPGLLSHWRSSRQLARRGYIALSPGRPKLRHRILPRSVIGISAMLLSAGIGAAFSGAAFYAYYDDRLAQNEAQVATFVDGFEAQFTDASGAIDEMRVESVEQIRRELGPLSGYVEDANGIVTLPATAGPSVWSLSTFSPAGEPAVGAAFAVVGYNGGTALVTSYELIKAATVSPGPAITLTKGDQTLTAEVYSWDAEHDLALVVVDADIPKLKLATGPARDNAIGGRLFAMSGVGGQGATASPGFLIDQSTAGIQHTIPTGTLFQGGPLVNSSGVVIGIASLSYNPLGINGGAVSVAADVNILCAQLLRCADEANDVTVDLGGEEPAAGDQADQPVDPDGEGE